MTASPTNSRLQDPLAQLFGIVAALVSAVAGVGLLVSTEWSNSSSLLGGVVLLTIAGAFIAGVTEFAPPGQPEKAPWWPHSRFPRTLLFLEFLAAGLTGVGALGAFSQLFTGGVDSGVVDGICATIMIGWLAIISMALASDALRRRDWPTTTASIH